MLGIAWLPGADRRPAMQGSRGILWVPRLIFSVRLISMLRDLHLVICGGRDYQDRDTVFRVLDAIHARNGIALILEGGATGADRLAREWAKSRGVLFQTFDAEWGNLDAPGAMIRTRRDGTRYNARAGPDRNARMLAWEHLSGIVAFPGGSGTQDMVRQARAKGVTVWEPVRPN